jgi:hypothetical protein
MDSFLPGPAWAQRPAFPPRRRTHFQGVLLGLALVMSFNDRGVPHFLRGRDGIVLGKILAHFYLHFPTVKSWAMRPFARPAVFGDPT